MNVDDIPGQLEELFDRARDGLAAQVTKARKVVADLNAEKAVASKALVELKDQCTKAKAELETTLADLDRASSLRGLNSEIKKARAELEQLNAATAKESKALEALTRKRVEAEARLVTLENDARAATAERCRAQEMMEQLKNRLRSITLAA